MEITKRNLAGNIKKDNGLDGDNGVENTLTTHLGAFILSNSKRIMNNFIKDVNGFYSISIYYGDTDSFYMGKKHLNVLDKANLAAKELCRGKK